MNFTSDADVALTAAGFSRRRFLHGAGVLVVGFSTVRITDRVAIAETMLAQGMRGSDGQLDSWLAIAADGGVTAYTGKCELGQGMQTAQTQLVAEELSVAIGRIRLIQCD